MGRFPTRGGNAADHEKGQRSGRRATLVAPRPQVLGLPSLSHKGDVQHGLRERGRPRGAHPGTGHPPLGVGGEADARDHGAFGAGGLGCWQGSRTSAPCATPKPCPVRHDTSPLPPFEHAAPEETATAEDNV